ncbi:hypothetical protein GCM10009624_27890 [Gordonia sinesedis]
MTDDAERQARRQARLAELKKLPDQARRPWAYVRKTERHIFAGPPAAYTIRHPDGTVVWPRKAPDAEASGDSPGDATRSQPGG